MNYIKVDTLIGKKISAIAINADKASLILQVEEDVIFILEATGDSCSHSWFEHITSLDSLIGATINHIEKIFIDIVEEKDSTFTKSYSYNFITDKGKTQIEMRNIGNMCCNGFINILNIGPNDIHRYSINVKKLTEDF
jgi:hypothetical protein